MRALPMKQDESNVTHAAKLTKEEGELDFRQPAATVHNKVKPLTDPSASLDAVVIVHLKHSQTSAVMLGVFLDSVACHTSVAKS